MKYSYSFFILCGIFVCLNTLLIPTEFWRAMIFFFIGLPLIIIPTLCVIHDYIIREEVEE